MTVKEIEARSGMTRANIRFYESEGLLSPARLENGYRDYSEKDLETLERIKLLRTLRLPLEEIKEVQAGKRPLEEALAEQADRLTGVMESVRRCQEVCREMCRDQVRFETLNARKYLDSIERGGAVPVPSPLAADQVPREFVPWRRYFARMFDITLCNVAWQAIMSLGFHIPFNWDAESGLGRVAAIQLSMALLLVLEPLLLSLCKTTPGKWIMGLRVADNNGGRLTYKKAFVRTWGAVWGGLCGGLFMWIALWRYKQYSEGKTLPWEYDSELEVKPLKAWQVLGYLAGLAACVGGIVLVTVASLMPPCRGDLTPAQLVRNVNALRRVYNWQGGYALDESGQWYDVSGVMYLDVEGNPIEDLALPPLEFTMEDGVITAIVMEKQVESSAVWDSMLPNAGETGLAIRAFLLAPKEAGLSRKGAEAVLQGIDDHRFDSFSMTVNGIRVTFETRYSGYAEPGDGIDYGGSLLAAAEGESGTGTFWYRLSMEKIASRADGG